MFFLALTCTAHADELVGQRVPSFPNGMYQEGGSCTATGTQDPCHRMVGVLMSAAGKETSIYVSTLDGRDEKGTSYQVVTDVIPYPKVNSENNPMQSSMALYRPFIILKGRA